MKDAQRKLLSLHISYNRSLKQAVNHTKKAQNIILDYYTDDIIKSFKTWDLLLTDINFICYEDLGTGKLIAIKLIKDKYNNFREKDLKTERK